MTTILRILLTSLYFISASLTYAQSVAMLSLKDQSVPERTSLSIALQNLENRYQVHFNYASEVVDNKQVPKTSFGADSIEASLHKLLSPLNLSYEKVKDDVFFIGSR